MIIIIIMMLIVVAMVAQKMTVAIAMVRLT
jgi:hypothetical protein